jgi:hypothetical protein
MGPPFLERPPPFEIFGFATDIRNTKQRLRQACNPGYIRGGIKLKVKVERIEITYEKLFA